MDKFVNLHSHNMFSILDGYGKPEDFIKRVKELGQTALATTNHGSISDHFKFYEICKKEGIKPILGIEAYVVDNALEKTDRYRYHLTLLAKNAEGYRNLLKLVSLAYEEGFYYKPRIDWQMLKDHANGLIATSSCPSGKIGNIIENGGSIEDVKTEMLKQKAIFQDYYVELQPWTYAGGQKMAPIVYNAARELGLPIVLTMDCHYPKEEDAFKQEVLLCIQTGDQWSNPKRMRFDQNDFYLKSGEQVEKEWKERFPDLPFLEEMITNTAKIADMVDFEFPKATPISYPYEGDKPALLWQMIEEGMKERGLDQNKTYQARAKLEFDLIVSKNFVDYFLVIADLIQWAKKNNILVGPARGSSCGSLVCYVTKITEVDPIHYDLLFERFIDLNRTDLPDIDIDFEDDRRFEVKDYLREKYGFDHVASLATFGTFQGRMCIQDIGRVFSDKIPYEVIAEVKKLIVQRSGGDSRFGFSVEDTFVNFDNAAKYLKEYPELDLAKHFEGQVRSVGMHAAGTIVSNEPITNFAAFYRSAKDSGEKVISMDYHDASSIGLLKIDILGLSTLSILQNALKLIKQRHGKTINLYDLPLDEKEVFDYFKKGKFFGVFQFDGSSMMQVCRQILPDNFEELVAINALSRPGPLHSGGTTSYANRKWKKEEIRHKHPIIEKITKDTYGVTIYQEQVMLIVKNLGEFSWKDTSTIRQTMSKSRGVEAFSKFEEKFIEGAKKHGVGTQLATDIWKQIYTFGSWAFNKSHSVAYTTIGYWCMWLKLHYPMEFYVSILQREKDEVKLRRNLKEYSEEGYKILPIDINKSKENFAIDGKAIRQGLMTVKGLGEASAATIIAHQPYKDFIDFKERTKLKKMSETLLELGAFASLNFTHLSKQQDLFGGHLVANQVFDYKKPDESFVRKHVPMYVKNESIKRYGKWVLENKRILITPIKKLGDMTGKNKIAIIGMTDPNIYYNPKNKVEESRSKGKPMVRKEGEEKFTNQDYDFLNFDLEDETDYISVRIPYKLYPKLKAMMWDVKATDVLLIEGMITGFARMVFANNVTNLTMERSFK